MSLTRFKIFLDREKEAHPERGTYINMCSILQESGCGQNEIYELFIKYMPPDEYDRHEIDEMVAYLCKLAKQYTPD